jgi:HK97 family phage major capsid protein
MGLAALRAKLAELLKGKAALEAAAKAADSTKEQKQAYRDSLIAISETVVAIKDLEKEQELEGIASTAATAPTGDLPATNITGEPVYAAPVDEREKSGEWKASLAAACYVKSIQLLRSGVVKSALDIMREDGYGRVADALLKEQADNMRREGRINKSNSSLTPQDGGILLPTPNSGTIIPLLRAENTFINQGPQRVPLVGGKFNMPVGLTGATAGYIGEGAKKPVGSPTFGSISMLSKKIAGIVMLTEEILAWSLADIRAYVENDLRETLASTMDTALYFGVGSATVPNGILQRTADINVFDASTGGAGALFADPKKPTTAELDALASRMILAITDRNIGVSTRFSWVMNYHLQQYLLNVRGANGQPIYPEVKDGQWKGIRLTVTNAFPNNGGTATDESILALIDWSNVLYGEDQAITVRTSTEATIDPGTGVLVHLFQQNMMALLMEARHDVALRRQGAISVLRKARWGTLAAA